MKLALDGIESPLRIAGRKAAAILSGGNIDRDLFAAVLNQESFQSEPP